MTTIYLQSVLRFSNLNSIYNELASRTDTRTNEFTRHLKIQHAILLKGIISENNTLLNLIDRDRTKREYYIQHKYETLFHDVGRLTCKLGRESGFPLKYDTVRGMISDDS